MGAASPQPPDSTANALRKARWRELLIVLVVLAGVIALGVFGPDRSEEQPPSAATTQQAP